MENIDNTHRGIPIKDRMKLGRIRRVMAKSMHEVVQRSALSQIAREMDLTELRELQKSPSEKKASLNVYLLAAVAHTLRLHPLINSEFFEGKIITFDQINLGMAVAVPDGLVVPVIHEADKKSIQELSDISKELATKAREGKLAYADIEGGTFTLSNLGMYDIDTSFPLPRSPESAILLVGRAKPKAEVINGEIAIREMAWFSLTYDHRFIDGAVGAKFLQDLQKTILNPSIFIPPT